MIEIRIEVNDAGQRLDKYLTKAFPSLPRTLMYKAIRNKKIKVNRKRAEISTKLVEGDALQIFLPPDVLSPRKFVPEDKPIDIVYEDDDYLIVNKPAGLLSQKDEAGDQDNLNWRIQSYLYRKGCWNPETERSFIPAVAHRLDRNTSGLVAAGKTAAASRHLSQLIRDGKVQKEYMALVEGTVDEPMDVSLYLKKEGTISKVSDVAEDGYVSARMRVEPIRQQSGTTLCHIIMDTGRFHQIRACMAHIGHPLVGDHKYGGHGNRPYSLTSTRLSFDNIDATL